MPPQGGFSFTMNPELELIRKYAADNEVSYANVYILWNQTKSEKVCHRFVQESKNYDCVDTIRVHEISGDKESSDKYKRIRNAGCCGSHDFLVFDMESIYIIGFNYGH